MLFMFFCKIFMIFSSFSFSVGSVVSPLIEEVNYRITKEMVTVLDSGKFVDYTKVPWTSAYFDVNQFDLQLVSGFVRSYGEQDDLKVEYVSDVVGVPLHTYAVTGRYDFDNKDLIALSKIFFNHNFLGEGRTKENRLSVTSFRSTLNLITLRFEITKPLSFYIKSFMFSALKYSPDATVLGFTFSFLDYDKNVRYSFGLDGGGEFIREGYNFVSMPFQVPNLSELEVSFYVQSTSTSEIPGASLGQINIFAMEAIVPVPPKSPFNPEYERVSWYDFFGHLRNAFRWVVYGVIGSVLPVDLLRDMLFSIDSILRLFFTDTVTAAIGLDFAIVLENAITVFVFYKSVGFFLG